MQAWCCKDEPGVQCMPLMGAGIMHRDLNLKSRVLPPCLLDNKGQPH
jgi:hypothetical protein